VVAVLLVVVWPVITGYNRRPKQEERNINVK